MSEYLIKENVFWDGKCVHKWTSANTKKYMVEPSDRYIDVIKKGLISCGYDFSEEESKKYFKNGERC